MSGNWGVPAGAHTSQAPTSFGAGGRWLPDPQSHGHHARHPAPPDPRFSRFCAPSWPDRNQPRLPPFSCKNPPQRPDVRAWGSDVGCQKLVQCWAVIFVSRVLPGAVPVYGWGQQAYPAGGESAVQVELDVDIPPCFALHDTTWLARLPIALSIQRFMFVKLWPDLGVNCICALLWLITLQSCSLVICHIAIVLCRHFCSGICHIAFVLCRHFCSSICHIAFVLHLWMQKRWKIAVFPENKVQNWIDSKIEFH